MEDEILYLQLETLGFVTVVPIAKVVSHLARLLCFVVREYLGGTFLG